MSEIKPSTDFFERDILEALAQYHLSGDGAWLLEAVRRCGQYGKPIPRIVREPFDAALLRHVKGEVRTLDEAFSAQRPKSRNRPAELNHNRYGWKIFLTVQHLREEGRALDEELFTDVAKSFPFSWSTVRNIYREVADFMEQQKRLMAES